MDHKVLKPCSRTPSVTLFEVDNLLVDVFLLATVHFDLAVHLRAIPLKLPLVLLIIGTLRYGTARL